MAACGSLQHIFEKPLPENPTLMESLSSWNQIKSMRPIEFPSYTEIFGELHFKENPDSSSSSHLPFSSSASSSSSSSLTDLILQSDSEKVKEDTSVDNNEIGKNPSMGSLLGTEKNQYSDGFQSKNMENLQLCTEGLGFESSDDVEDAKDDWESHDMEEKSITKHSSLDNPCWEFKRSNTSGRGFPPPISCIGRTGKPWVCFKSYRHDGRFVLKEIKIPTQEFLHAFREDGRLKLHFVQPDDKIPEEEEETEGEGEEEEDEEAEEEEEEEEEEDEGEGEGEDDADEGEPKNIDISKYEVQTNL